MRTSHYWHDLQREAHPALLAVALCNAPETVALLSRASQPALTWLDRFVAVFTTPFKKWGVSGWKETGCPSHGTGQAVRDAQHSTDGFWTIDVDLRALRVGGLDAD